MTDTGVVVERTASPHLVRNEWSELAAAGGNVFSSFEWTELWWRHFGRRGSLHVLSARRPNGALATILPLYASRAGPFRVLRFTGSGLADQLGPLYRRGDGPVAAEALARALHGPAVDYDVFVGERLPGTESWASRVGAKVLDRTGNPVLETAGVSWEEYLRSRSSNFREQIRARERGLTRRYDLRYRLAEDPDRLSTDLDCFFSLHRARWGAESSFAASERFQREFAVTAMQRGWLRLWFLDLDKRTAAAWLGFRYGGVDAYYQAGRDPVLGHESVGFVLLAHTIREAFGDGVREYRFLRGSEAYKYRFASRDRGLETIATGRGIKGKIGLGVATRVARFSPVRHYIGRTLRRRRR